VTIGLNPDTATREQYVLNILAAWKAATPAQKSRGRFWYRTAHDLAEMISDGQPVKGAGVIAALSANKRWADNVRLAQRALTGDLGGHVGDALRKAAAIMAGADPALVLPMGAKTGHFYRCILNPADADAVVIDRHAHDIAVGEVHGCADRGLSTPRRYAILAHAYREAAARLGEIPSVVQAVTWVWQTERLAGVGTRCP
jgi:hypothetical protein